MKRDGALDDGDRLHRRAWLRGLIAGAVGLTLMSVFGGGSCHYDDDDWDDDDDDWDDDDDDFGPSTLAEDVPSYRLEDFELVPSAHARAHPVAQLRGIQGLSIGAWAGTRELGRDEFADFTAKVLEHNHSLIGLPRSAGRLVLAAVDFESDSTVVRYVQLRDFAGAEQKVAGAELTFRFDLIGNLLTIENSTVL